MGETAHNLLKSFESLPEAERQEVLEQLLRRAATLPHAFPSAEELEHAADEVFQSLDRREQGE